jgi:peptidoglycan/xylan/chitin deacetylase (PgdA/CDA1 family)
MKSYFIISLDTEVDWGYRAYPGSKMYNLLKNNKSLALESIYRFIDLFEKYNIPATWAIVGRLFYDFPEIIDNITSNPIDHEIGYHSFSHIRFSDCDEKTADSELEMALKISKMYGIKFDSFVFPENAINHVHLLKKYGFKIYRSYNLAGMSINKNIIRRSYNFALSKLISPPVEPKWDDGIYELPSSMMLHDISLFSRTLPIRAKMGIKKSINEGKIFHIFIHPEDIILKPQLFSQMEDILKYLSEKRKNDEIRTITMGKLAGIL